MEKCLKKKIAIIGMGPGHRDFLLPAAAREIERADILAGAPRHLEEFSASGKETYEFGADLPGLARFLKSARESKRAAVLASGDPAFYGILKYLRKFFAPGELDVFPGLSSFQYLFSRLGEDWQDAELLSLHGREADFTGAVKRGKKVVLLTDKKNTPQAAARRLLDAGLGDTRMVIGSRLSYGDESIIRTTAAEAAAGEYPALSVVILYGEKYEQG